MPYRMPNEPVMTRVGPSRATLGMALVHRHTAAERGRGHKLLAEVSEMCRRTGEALGDLPTIEVCMARESFPPGLCPPALSVSRLLYR